MPFTTEPPPLATRVIAVRHGETDWNAGQRIQGHTDIALNAKGRWQAGRLAAALADEDLHAIYSSDLQRAWATAAACAHGRDLTVRTVPGLRERGFGSFEGLSFDEIERRWPERALRWRRRDPGFAPEGGEALAAFHDRSVQAAAALAQAHRGRTILLVAHGGVLDALYRAATRAAVDAPRSWLLGNATVNRLLHSDEGFALVGWNDDAHLEGWAGAAG
jgi:probable phosphoglycerate mutase